MNGLSEAKRNPLAAGDTPKAGDILITSQDELLVVVETTWTDKGLIVEYRHLGNDNYSSRRLWDEMQSRYSSGCKILHASLEKVEAEAETTALALRGNEQQIEAHKRRAELLRNRAVVLKRMIGYMTEPIRDMVRKMESRINHLTSMLRVIEAYVGVYESVISIRNGSKLYRVATGFSLGDLLYPKQGEFAEIVEEAMKEREAGDDRYYAQGEQLQWQRNIAILQGLIERTDVFKPLLHEGINLFLPETIGDAIRLIRDGENTLPDGHLTWHQWQRQENNKIQRGDRVIFSGLNDHPKDDYVSRLIKHA